MKFRSTLCLRQRIEEWLECHEIPGLGSRERKVWQYKLNVAEAGTGAFDAVEVGQVHEGRHSCCVIASAHLLITAGKQHELRGNGLAWFALFALDGMECTSWYRSEPFFSGQWPL